MYREQVVPRLYLHEFLFFFFTTASDWSDDEFEDNNESEPPYPGHHFDKYMAKQGKKQRIHKHNQEMAWSAGIAPGVYKGL